jgi:uncharacterized protein (DUF488 family)
MTHPFFTIGHSTRSVGEFVDLLKPQEINIVVDVRAMPRSRANPQYSAANLSRALSEFEIGYEHIAALGACAARSGMCRRT